jgi:hypothetical protein
MRYRYLSEVGVRYEGEVNKPGMREVDRWNDIATALKTAIVDLRNLENAQRASAAGPAAVAPAGSRVRALIQFHQQKQGVGKLSADIEAARQEVERCRLWLSRQGVTADRDGNVTPQDIEPRVVIYDKEAARQGLTLIHFARGLLFTDANSQKPLDTSQMVTNFSGPGKAIYVMSETGNLHVSSHVMGNRHHSSLLAGSPVACGGELEAHGGRLTWLSNKSGHYMPKVPHLLQVLHQMQKKGVPMTFRLLVCPSLKTYLNVGAFLTELQLAGEDDYELSKLMRYSDYLNDTVLGETGWRWRRPEEPKGVYDAATDALVPHKQVRTWLKSAGRMAATKTFSR